jgi:TonB-linked SusC/RagA family outer membrane protein
MIQTPKWVPLTLKGLPTNWSQASINTFNPIGLFNSGDYETSQGQTLTLNANVTYKPLFIPGLNFKVQFGKINSSGTSKQYFPSYNVYNFVRTGQNGLLYSDVLPSSGITTKVGNTDRLAQGTNYANSYQLIGSIGYARKFGKHDIDFLALTEQREAENNDYLLYRDGQQIPGIDQMFAFNAANTTVQLSGPFESGKRSYLGRLSYMFNDKYLMDIIARVDGSANFPPNKRWGVFPAIGLGWKISEEEFFRRNLPFVNFLKLRANFGLVGDDRVTGYQYVSRFTQTTGMLFGTTVTNGLDPNIYPNPDITWEKARTLNYGFDASFLRSRLSVSVDIWNRHTYDGFDDLGVVSNPYTVGINTGLKNYGIQNSWGTELTAGFRDMIGKDWGYSIDVNAAFGDNQVIRSYYAPGKLGTPTEYSDIMIGKSSRKYNSSNYGYLATGILRTQAEVDALLAKSPNYKINGVKPQVGFMNFEDVNNDGVIDDKDITPMFNSTASIAVFGFTIGITYKTFKFSTNINLYLGGKQFVDGEARKPPTTTTNAPSFWKDHWTPDNPNAKYPRADAPLITSNSTFWALSGTTSRINNMTLSYSIPPSISERFKIPDFRVLVSGTNLWSIVNPFKYKDISTNNFVTYPFLRTISVGINMSL